MTATTIDTAEPVTLAIARALVREKLTGSEGDAPSKEQITEAFKADPQGYRTAARRVVAALNRAGYAVTPTAE